MKCKNGVNFEDCELAVLRSSVDKIQEKQGKKKIQLDETIQIIDIVENFLKTSRCVCYGGTAINNILPPDAQFYNKSVEFPDYDYYSPNALRDAEKLADIYYKKGFTEVEAKSGVHHGTYKVYVNFIPVADITQMNDELFKHVYRDSLIRGGIRYCSPNFLRMAMYLELSRPLGDVSRWEKVLKRISLLNKYFPLKGEDCKYENIQRLFVSKKISQSNVFNILLNTFLNDNVVFFGAYAYKFYSKHMPLQKSSRISAIPDFDILSEHPKDTVDNLKQQFKSSGIKMETKKHDAVGEIISEHYEIIIDGDTVAFIYKPLACHSYNIIRDKNRQIRVATIDTMMSFYLAFFVVDRPYYDNERILCICEFLFKVQQKNRLSQKGILKRFSMECIGSQPTLASMRAEKSIKFKELRNKRTSKEYKSWFLRYIPHEEKHKLPSNTQTKSKTKTKTKPKTVSVTKRNSIQKTKRKTKKPSTSTSSSFFSLLF